jgi:hypothetical protein
LVGVGKNDVALGANGECLAFLMFMLGQIIYTLKGRAGENLFQCLGNGGRVFFAREYEETA